MKHFVFLIFILHIFSCTQDNVGTRFKIGFSQCCEDEWRKTMNDEMLRELAFHPELDLIIVNAQNNSSKQIDDINSLLDQGVDLLIVSPNEAKPLTKTIDSIFAMGIPVLLVDRKTESEKFNAFVGGDNLEIGKTAANYLQDMHQEGLNVVELQLGMTMTPAKERSKGFQDQFQNISKHKIVSTIEDKNGIDETKKSFLLELKNHPEINAVYAHNDGLAKSAREWLTEAGIQKEITIVGVDGLMGEGNGIDLVEHNLINASLLYPTGGSEAISIALSILHKLPYEKINKLSTIIINSSNARTINLQMKKIEGLQQSIDNQQSLVDSLKKIFKTQRNYILLLAVSLLAAFILGWFLWQSLKKKEIANNELTEKQIQILKMSEELTLATNAKVNFFTNISHDLRTPLSLILGLSDELIAENQKDKSISSKLRQVQQNSLRLLRLINQLMDFRKIESGQIKLVVAEYDIIEFISAIAQSFKFVANQRNIKFEILHQKGPLLVWFDPDKMDKVVFNLFSNAFKFTPDSGSITISILQDSFHDIVKINIEDSGIGIPEESCEHIFEPFYQVQNTYNAGTGLGLSLVKTFIELHKGTIAVSSIKGKGSRFTIELPLGNKHFSEDQIEEEQGYAVSSDAIYDESINYQLGLENDREIKPLSGYHVLIIEDNLELQDFLKRNLNPLFQISQSMTGDEGLAAATTLLPDIIICDLSLPGLDGMEIIKALKSDLRTSHIPTIVLTARASIHQQIESSMAGVDAFLTKPFNIHLLAATIENLIHNRKLLLDNDSKQKITLLDQKAVNPMDEEFIEKVNAFIQNHFKDSQFQITDLCREVNLSRSQLYRKTKALLGENIGDYLQNKRLAHAEELLQKSELSISEIAYASGFSSPHYFATVFKQKYNMSPSQFRTLDK